MKPASSTGSRLEPTGDKDVAIRVRDLRKDFVVNTSGAASIKTSLLWWKKRKFLKKEVLKGISFDVHRGECVAVVGRNGAGKSTLLALLARVYRPTAGTIKVNGRVAPLLELGAGFHPDLSGAENVYFNAAILGLSRKETEKRFKSIVEFSEIGANIWAPVRTYSSGMTARLGFSIAIHVDADILIIDEVLAVGDFEFTKKCHDEIQRFKAEGGTILLVSHQLPTIKGFADRAIWIQHGEIMMSGTPDEVAAAYYANSESDLARQS